jgi:electron transfer flavoprotein alpha subunit
VILVLVEREGSRPTEISAQALSFARTLGGPLKAVALDDSTAASLGAAAARLVETVRPEVVLAAGTDHGNEVMAHLAAILDLPLATNVTEVFPGEVFELDRLRWGGSLRERARLEAGVKLLTVAPHTWPAEDASDPVEVLTSTEAEQAGVTRTDEPAAAAGVSLTTAPIIVSGGRGVGSAEGFGLLEQLAGLLGAAVGCSRVATNNGWRPHSDQVGQTGTRVAPDLYIACGISGAIQHWVGMMAAKNAPMVTKADYAVIGDLHQILPAVIAEIKKRRGT